MMLWRQMSVVVFSDTLGADTTEPEVTLACRPGSLSGTKVKSGSASGSSGRPPSSIPVLCCDLAPVLRAVASASEAVVQEVVQLLALGKCEAALVRLQGVAVSGAVSDAGGTGADAACGAREGAGGDAGADVDGGGDGAGDGAGSGGGGGADTGAGAYGGDAGAPALSWDGGPRTALYRVAQLGTVFAQVRLKSQSTKLFVEDQGLREELAAELQESQCSADRLHVSVAVTLGVGLPPVDGGSRLQVLLCESSTNTDPVVVKADIVFPQPGDAVSVACFPLNVPHQPAAIWDRLAKRASKGIKFLRDSLWGIQRRFVLLSLVPGRPFDLMRVHGVHDGVVEWARRAVAQLLGMRGPSGSLFAPTATGVLVEAQCPMFIVLSWDSKLHKNVCTRLRRFLRVAAVPLAPFVRSCVVWPAVPEAVCATCPEQVLFADLLQDLFTDEVSRSVACCARLSGQGVYAAAVKHVLCTPPQRGADGGHSICVGLVVLGVNPATEVGARLLQAGRQWGEDCSPGVSSRQLVHHAVCALVGPWPPEIAAPLLGEALGRRVGRVVENVGGDQRVAVHQVGTCSVVNSKLVDRGRALRDAAVEGSPPELGAVPAGCMRLFHGTTQRAATSILREGVSFGRLSEATDFGKALYLTTHFGIAFQCAYAAFVAGGAGDVGLSAVIAVDVEMDALVHGWRVLDLGPKPDPWRQTVCACRRGGMAHLEEEDPALYADYSTASVVVGPITSNAERVDSGYPPLPSPWVQYAFMKPAATRRLLLPGVVVGGRVAVHAVQVLLVYAGAGDLES